MRRIHAFILTAFVSLLLATGLANATDDAPLTASDIQRWADTMQGIRQWAEDHSDRADALGDEGDFMAMQSFFADMQAANEAILQRHGFESQQEWNAIGNRIGQAYMALGMRDMLEQIESSLAEQPAEPDHPQQQMMREQMEQQITRMRAQIDEVPKGDIEAVTAERETLERVFSLD